MKMINALWSSDHHTRHPHTPTRHILSNMDKFYYRDNDLSTIGLNVFGGDFYHDLAPANDPDMLLTQRWAKKHFQRCHDNKVHTRILEGTSSHDWGQPEILEILKPKDSPYIKYINKLCVEFIPDLDIHVLYVPDNFGKINTELVYEMALEEMAKAGITQVDFIFLHGGFKFQLPPIADKHGTLYDEVKWSKLAKHAIFSGHIHKPAQHLNIYCSGSFDRTAYGEMHAKGAYRFSFNKEKFTASFYENKDAQIYDYMDVRHDITSKELVKLLNNYLAKKPPHRTHLKVRGGPADVVVPLITDYRERYPQYILESENIREGNIEIDDTLYSPEAYQGITLSKDNLKDNLFRYMATTIQQNSDTIDEKLLSELLEEVMND